MQENIPCINLDDGLKRIRGNKKLYVKMLDMFLENKEAEMLERSLADNKLEEAADIAHAIKGMTGNLSLLRLSDVSNELMESLKGGKRDEHLIALYREALEKTTEQARVVKRELEAELGL